MPTSVATVIIEGRDRASDDIKQVIRSVDRLDTATRNVKGLDGGDLSRTMRGGAAAARDATTATSGLGGSLRSLSGTAAGLAGVFGVAFGAQAIVGFGQEALALANTFEITEARVKALAGSTDRYNDLVANAKRQQAEFGGTLQENLDFLGSFVNLSTRTGVSIDSITDAARRLEALEPAQGIEGATYALREFLSASGSEALTSLGERFEIPKDKLRELTDESVAAPQRIAGLIAVLDELGITTEFVAAANNTTARSFKILGSAWTDFSTKVGAGISTALEPAAEATTDFLRRLTELGTIEQLVTTTTGERGAALQAMLPQILAVSAGTREEDDAVRALIAAYYAGTGAYADITTGTALFHAELTGLIAQQDAAAAAADASTLAWYGMTKAQQDAAFAAVEERNALADATEEAALNEAQNRLAAQANDELADRAAAAAQAILESGNASAAAKAAFAAQYGVTVALIDVYLRLADAARIARAAMDQYNAQEILTRQGVEPTRKDQSRTDLVAQEHAQAVQELEQRRAAAEKAAKAAQAAAKKTGAANKSAGNAAEKAAREAEAAQKKAQREAERAQAEAERAAEELQKAQDDLLTNEERLAVYRERLAAGDLPEVERLRLMKEIRDLEEDISNEQEKQRRAAIDAQLAAIDDRKQRREEAKEIAAAQRVLASSGTSEAQKAAARDVLERIPLEQAKRAQEIADTLEDAGQAAPPAELTTMPVGGPTTPVPVTIAQSTLPPIALPAAAAQGALTFNATIVLPDGTMIGSGSATTPFGRDPITDLRLALRATGA